MDPLKYSLIIEWSDEDNKYIVTLPEFPNNHTHGVTYEEALRNGKEAIEALIEHYELSGLPLPQPHKDSVTPQNEDEYVAMMLGYADMYKKGDLDKKVCAAKMIQASCTMAASTPTYEGLRIANLPSI
jgi:predicted RNase H-like HicB family nuclease